VIALWLAAYPMGWSSLTAAEIHRLEGITVYFGGLLLLYALVQRVDEPGSPKRQRREGGPVFRYALPLACYYLVTLGLPLINGASQAGEAFLTHAMVVLLVPPALILLVCAGRWLFSRYPRRNVSAGSSAHARRAGSHAAATATRTMTPVPNR
jgi:hypothetical protein